MEPIHRVVIADPQAAVRRGLRAVFASQPDFEVMAEAADAMSAVRSVRRHKPHLALLDPDLVPLGGPGAISEIKEAHPGAKVLVLTERPDEESWLACLRAGADGYMTKGAALDELLLAARRVVQGHAYVAPQICEPLIQGYLKATEGARCPGTLDALSDQERQLLRLLAEGRLSMSSASLESDTARLRERLGIRTFDGLAAYAKFAQKRGAR